MKSYRQLAIEYNVHVITIRRWVKASGIIPEFLEPSTSGKKGGLLTILNDTQQAQLHNWLIETGRIND